MEELYKSIETMKFDKNIKNILLNNNINTIQDLCNYSRMELSNINLNNMQINKISIELQLKGLDLKANHAKRNAILDHYIRNYC